MLAFQLFKRKRSGAAPQMKRLSVSCTDAKKGFPRIENGLDVGRDERLDLAPFVCAWNI